MKITQNIKEFLKTSQILSGVNILITDTEKVIFDLNIDNESFLNKRIEQIIKECMKNNKQIFLTNLDNLYIIENEVTVCKSIILEPLQSKDKVVGSLIFWKKDSNFLEIDREFIKTDKRVLGEMLNN